MVGVWHDMRHPPRQGVFGARIEKEERDEHRQGRCSPEVVTLRRTIACSERSRLRMFVTGIAKPSPTP